MGRLRPDRRPLDRHPDRARSERPDVGVGRLGLRVPARSRRRVRRRHRAWSTLPADPNRPRLTQKTVTATSAGPVVTGYTFDTSRSIDPSTPALALADVWDGTSWKRLPPSDQLGISFTWTGQRMVDPNPSVEHGYSDGHGGVIEDWGEGGPHGWDPRPGHRLVGSTPRGVDRRPGGVGPHGERRHVVRHCGSGVRRLHRAGRDSASPCRRARPLLDRRLGGTDDSSRSAGPTCRRAPPGKPSPTGPGSTHPDQGPSCVGRDRDVPGAMRIRLARSSTARGAVGGLIPQGARSSAGG